MYEANGFSEAELRELKVSLEALEDPHKLVLRRRRTVSRNVKNGTIEVHFTTGPSLEFDKDREFRKI